MNIVIDSNIKLDRPCTEHLRRLLKKGEAPSVLNEVTGKLEGSFNETESTVFITGIPVDVMKYHGDFFRKYQAVPQWFFIVIGANTHGVALLKKAEIIYNLNSCRFYYAPTAPKLFSAIDEIAADYVSISGKTLIFFKHKKDTADYAEQLAAYLFDGDKDKYEIAYDSIDPKSGAGALLICGEEERDFKQITVPETMKPVFAVIRPEKHLQQYLHPEHLYDLLALSFDMTAERVKTRTYFVSVVAQEWFQKRNVGKTAAENGLLMWDGFGLPVSRSNYSADRIEGFLSDGYFDTERLKQFLLK